MRKWYEFSEKDVALGIITFLILIILAYFTVLFLSIEDEPSGKDGTYYITYDIPNSYILYKYNRSEFINQLQAKGCKIMPYYLTGTYGPYIYDSTAFLIGNIVSGNDTIEACIKFESNAEDEENFRLWSFYSSPLEIDSLYKKNLYKYKQTFEYLLENDSLTFPYEDYDSEEN